MEHTHEKNTEAEQAKSRRSANKESRNKQMFLIGLAGFLGAIVIAFAVFGIVRVYAQAATDSATGFVATVLRLPLAKVDGQTIFYSEYLSDLKAIHRLSDYDKKAGGMTGSLTEDQMSDQVVWRLANNIFINELARIYGVTVTDEDVETIKSQMLEQFESVEEAEKELMDRYGWTLKVYEKKVIRPFMLQQKLAERFETDMDLLQAVRNQAESVLEEIKNGADFEETAKKYGQDSTAEKGGDLGWFSKGDMVPQFEEAVFALEKGELSDAIVETPYGYHIIRVDDKRIEPVEDETGKMVDTEQVRARHIIFLFPSLDQSLDKLIRDAQISWYVGKINDPIEEMLSQ